jgi:hypothetical protein
MEVTSHSATMLGERSQIRLREVLATTQTHMESSKQHFVKVGAASERHYQQCSDAVESSKDLVATLHSDAASAVEVLSTKAQEMASSATAAYNEIEESTKTFDNKFAASVAAGNASVIQVTRQ